MFKGSWKTTLGGSLTATGTLLMGAGVMDWMPAKVKTYSMIGGFALMAFGTFFAGLYARDNDKSPEDVGVK